MEQSSVNYDGHLKYSAGTNLREEKQEIKKDQKRAFQEPEVWVNNFNASFKSRYEYILRRIQTMPFSSGNLHYTDPLRIRTEN